jgi:hypothetical protein
MANPASFKPDSQASKNTELFWPHLKQAIAASSGFKRWVLEHNIDSKAQERTLDILVQSYLRQTLETLAY